MKNAIISVSIYALLSACSQFSDEQPSHASGISAPENFFPANIASASPEVSHEISRNILQQKHLFEHFWKNPLPRDFNLTAALNSSATVNSTTHSFIGDLPNENRCPTADLSFEMNTRTSGFDPNNAYWAMWLSRTIQMDESSILDRMLTIPTEESHLITRGILGLQAGVFRIDGKVFVTFRGTQDIADYIQNAFIDTVPGESAGLPGRVHQGFRDNFLALWQEVYDTAISMGAAETGVWLMGHSLGGVLSTFSAYNFVERNIAVHGVYEFGSPLPGNELFQKAYNARLGDRTFIIGYESDITPHVPPLPDAAESFSNVVRPELKALAKILTHNLNYRQVGSWYTLKRDGLLQKVENLADFQNRYYNKMRADNEKNSLPTLLFTNRRYTHDHETEYYHCGMRGFVTRQH